MSPSDKVLITAVALVAAAGVFALVMSWASGKASDLIDEAALNVPSPEANRLTHAKVREILLRSPEPAARRSAYYEVPSDN
jgi:hypothetical protein